MNRRKVVLLTCINIIYPLGVAMSAVLKYFLSSVLSYQQEGILFFQTSRWFYFIYIFKNMFSSITIYIMTPQKVII